ncbi:MAG: hypoxanthine phosphoribosyltransferase [Erysipelotrichaceae bacterium]|jgi:hypoxanthine phosphoribosyltransferase|nr:hypoxanthine phosphoribosyltransferase [Erysipelotrichaceae bacterium]
MHQDIKKILFTEEDIRKRCAELGEEISDAYRNTNHELLFVSILKGSIPFFAELIKHVDIDVYYDFIAARSYDGTESVGNIKIVKDLDCSVVDHDIILVEDIIDTGLTIKEIKKLLYLKGAHDVKVAALLNKQDRRVNDIQADFLGFEIPNEFVVGFGLDYNQKYRNLPYIGVLKEEKY